MKWREAKVKNNSQVPTQRYNHSMTAINNRQLIVFGGYDGDYRNDIWILMIDDDDYIEWKEIKVSVAKHYPCARYLHSCCKLGNKLIIMGGKFQKTVLNDVWMFDSESYRFSLLAPHVETDIADPFPDKQCPAVHGQQTVIVGQFLIVFGGNMRKGYSDQTYMFDLEKFVWIKASLTAEQQDSLDKRRLTLKEEGSSTPMARSFHTMSKIENNRVVLFGGIVETDVKKFACRYNDLWILETKLSQTMSKSEDFVPAIATEKRIANYVVERQLGAGGQGVVFLVHDEKQQLYALKRISLDFTSEGEERQVTQNQAFNEVLIHQKLKHTNVLSIESFFLEKIKVENQDHIRLNSM